MTPAGKERYGSKEKFEKQYPKDVVEKVKKNANTAKGVIDKSKKVAEEFQKVNVDKRSKKEKQARKQAEEQIRDRAYKMTDQELRNAVNRLNMEERYTQVMRDRATIDVGKSKVEKFMDVTAATLTIASTALSIAVASKELKNK